MLYQQLKKPSISETLLRHLDSIETLLRHLLAFICGYFRFWNDTKKDRKPLKNKGFPAFREVKHRGFEPRTT